MKPTERKSFFAAHREHITAEQMAAILKVGLPTIRNYEREFGKCLEVIETVREVEPKTLIQAERKARVLSESERENKQKLKYLESENERLQAEIEAVLEMAGDIKPIRIKAKKGKKTHEAVPFIIASDWHLDEMVDPAVVSGLNEYSMAIAEMRIQNFWRNALKLIQKQTRDVHVERVVVALLGDFITGYLRDENREANETQPIFAIIRAQELIAGGIQYLLDNTDYQFDIPCHMGNHSRITEKQRTSTEAGNSLEYFMYYNLRAHFADNPRVNFHIAKGYHSYVEVFEYTVRLHHGHYIRYGGGVGGPTIATNKAIANWNTSRKADLDVFGHLHMFFPADTFIINGSIIGWNAFANSIKAKYDPHPKQTFFLIQKGKGRTIVAPIFTD